ncbi:hypothetical protein [Pseudoxanthomonas sacheonensis]|uniref:RiboL-PSP-HEPN domain-containing protein n=1 Tax=Pseudoxanthomonas sacheonensis TaxID=443615 RepID=A0ABU1RSD7_9GAMM|nr:hypothetical protein [Pseudoxanthomonas sacheonensis]MDR6841024.1 hypothetical protein [Pseudoxanthomonas sacheonensis]
MKAEEEVDPLVEFRPTLHSTLTDKSIICIEVTENASSSELNEFVLECRNHVVPVKLWVAIPKVVGVLSTKDLAFAKANGIGIIEFDEQGNGRQLVGPPLSQSLTGLRAIDFSGFPSRYKEPLQAAFEMFKNGNPAKACSLVYDEIEALTRRITKKCVSKRCLKKDPQFDVDKASWSNVLEFLKTNIDPTLSGCPALKGPLFSRLIGLTEYRNDAGHKPSSTKKLIERDKQLRTRFESAVDELKTLIDASKAIKP